MLELGVVAERRQSRNTTGKNTKPREIKRNQEKHLCRKKRKMGKNKLSRKSKGKKLRNIYIGRKNKRSREKSKEIKRNQKKYVEKIKKREKQRKIKGNQKPRNIKENMEKQKKKSREIK